MTGRTVHVLLIDDDEDHHVLIRGMLARCRSPKYELACASNDQQGCEAMRTARYDVCLLSDRASSRDGWALRYEDHAADCAPPVILLTESGEPAVGRRVRAAGAADYLDVACLRRDLLERTIRYAIEHRQHREVIRRKNHQLERFLYTASHDLKSPLLAFNGYLRFLESDLDAGLTENLNEYVRTLKRASLRMGGMLDDLLDLSRAGRMGQRLQRVDLNRIVRQLCEEHQPMFVERAATVHVQGDLPTITADAARLVRALENLIVNALKHGCDDRGGVIEIGCESGEHEVRLFVRDHGPGIDRRHHEQIFELFHRMNRRCEGTGVGLSIVRCVAAAHNGRAWVESEPGAGATFYLALPHEVQARPRAA